MDYKTIDVGSNLSTLQCQPYLVKLFPNTLRKLVTVLGRCVSTNIQHTAIIISADLGMSAVSVTLLYQVSAVSVTLHYQVSAVSVMYNTPLLLTDMN